MESKLERAFVEHLCLAAYQSTQGTQIKATKSANVDAKDPDVLIVLMRDLQIPLSSA